MVISLRRVPMDISGWSKRFVVYLHFSLPLLNLPVYSPTFFKKENPKTNLLLLTHTLVSPNNIYKTVYRSNLTSSSHTSWVVELGSGQGPRVRFQSTYVVEGEPVEDNGWRRRVLDNNGEDNYNIIGKEKWAILEDLLIFNHSFSSSLCGTHRIVIIECGCMVKPRMLWQRVTKDPLNGVSGPLSSLRLKTQYGVWTT